MDGWQQCKKSSAFNVLIVGFMNAFVISFFFFPSFSIFPVFFSSAALLWQECMRRELRWRNWSEIRVIHGRRWSVWMVMLLPLVEVVINHSTAIQHWILTMHIPQSQWSNSLSSSSSRGSKPRMKSKAQTWWSRTHLLHLSNPHSLHSSCNRLLSHPLKHRRHRLLQLDLLRHLSWLNHHLNLRNHHLRSHLQSHHSRRTIRINQLRPWIPSRLPSDNNRKNENERKKKKNEEKQRSFLFYFFHFFILMKQRKVQREKQKGKKKTWNDVICFLFLFPWNSDLYHSPFSFLSLDVCWDSKNIKDVLYFCISVPCWMLMIWFGWVGFFSFVCLFFLWNCGGIDESMNWWIDEWMLEDEERKKRRNEGILLLFGSVESTMMRCYDGKENHQKLKRKAKTKENKGKEKMDLFIF